MNEAMLFIKLLEKRRENLMLRVELCQQKNRIGDQERSRLAEVESILKDFKDIMVRSYR